MTFDLVLYLFFDGECFFGHYPNPKSDYKKWKEITDGKILDRKSRKRIKKF